MALSTPPYVLQAGSHGAQLFRNAIGTLINSAGGIITPGDLTVEEQFVPDMTVLITAGQVWVKGTSAGSFPSGAPVQGLYYSEQTGSTTLSISASDAADPRIDTIIVQVEDSAYAGANDDIKLAVIDGTPTTGANLSNLTGAGVVPASSVVIAYVLVPALATTITTADILNVAPLANVGVGAWSLVPGTGPHPSVRLEGDIVRLKGVFSTTPAISAGVVLGTIPYHPPRLISLVSAVLGGNPPAAVGLPTLIQIDTAGAITLTANMAAHSSLSFDGLSFPLS